MERTDPKLYRPGVGIILLNPKNKKIFAGKRKGLFSHSWQMPQGGIDKGEEAEIAAKRELLEETNIKSAKIISQTQDWHYYNIPKEVIPDFWDGKYIGFGAQIGSTIQTQN